MTEPFAVYSPAGVVGYAFPESSCERAMSFPLQAVGGDCGSTDPGPYYLGSGTSHVAKEAVERDLRLLLRGARRHGIPLILGSAGTAGGEPHLEWECDVLRDVARKEGLHFRMAVVHAEQNKDYLLEKLSDGKITPLYGAPGLDADTVRRCERIVGQMGAEPLIAALESGAEVIVAGRSCDTAVFAAAALRAGYPAGPVWHMAKILECGSAAAEPKSGSDGIIGRVDSEGFTVEPANLAMRCTVERIAAHSLYENPNPYEMREPSGTIDMRGCTFSQVDERMVRVEGSEMRPETYTIKLEGVELVGYRAITIVGIRDPILITQLSGLLERVRAMVADRNLASEDDYTITFHVYGVNGAMGIDEPITGATPHEVGLLMDVVAGTQDLANALSTLVRTYVQVSDFPGRLCIAGNLAYPFSPNGFEGGPVYQFAMHHVVEPKTPLEMFPIELMEV